MFVSAFVVTIFLMYNLCSRLDDTILFQCFKFVMFHYGNFNGISVDPQDRWPTATTFPPRTASEKSKDGASETKPSDCSYSRSWLTSFQICFLAVPGRWSTGKPCLLMLQKSQTTTGNVWKPWKSWDKLSTNWCRIVSHQQYDAMTKGDFLMVWKIFTIDLPPQQSVRWFLQQGSVTGSGFFRRRPGAFPHGCWLDPYCHD